MFFGSMILESRSCAVFDGPCSTSSSFLDPTAFSSTSAFGDASSFSSFACSCLLGSFESVTGRSAASLAVVDHFEMSRGVRSGWRMVMIFFCCDVLMSGGAAGFSATCVRIQVREFVRESKRTGLELQPSSSTFGAGGRAGFCRLSCEQVRSTSL